MEHSTRLSTASDYLLYLLSSSFLLFSDYTSPIVASVGSSIADVTARPLSAW